MSNSEPIFISYCPSCQQRHQVHVTYLGMTKQCSGCRKPFVVRDPAAESAANHDPIHYWIQYTKHASDAEKFPLDERRPR